jgi:hypothetical protein
MPVVAVAVVERILAVLLAAVEQVEVEPELIQLMRLPHPVPLTEVAAVAVTDITTLVVSIPVVGMEEMVVAVSSLCG